MLYIGEKVGSAQGGGPNIDIALDPLEGTTITAKAGPNALAVLAIAEEGCLLHAPDVYMEKLAIGPGYPEGTIDLARSAADNVRAIAAAKGVEPGEIIACVLDRPRHGDLVKEIRRTGARIHFISDGDVAGAIMAVREGTGIDLLLGVGGTPEGIIAACAIKCLGGTIQAKLWPKDDEERQRALDAGHDLDQVLHTNDLVSGDNVFFVATGITDGELLRGVRYRAETATTQSLVMRSKSGTIRQIDSTHRLSKLRAYSTVDFERPS